MKGPLTIRDAHRVDLAACVGYARAAGVSSWDVRALDVCRVDAAYSAVVAERSGVVVGFGLGRAVADDAEIFILAVAPEHRGRGVGRALFGALSAGAVRCGAVRLGLEVRGGNRRALGFYERMGMSVSGRRPRYYSDGEDAVLMDRVPGVVSVPDVVILAGGARGCRPGEVAGARVARDLPTPLERALGAFGQRFGARSRLGTPTGDVFVVAPDDVARRLDPGPYRTVRDPEAGPGRALAHAAERVRAAWMFVAGVDDGARAARRVAGLVPEAQAGVDAVLVRERGGLQPCGGLYRVAAVRHAAARGDAGSLAAIRRAMVIREREGNRARVDRRRRA